MLALNCFIDFAIEAWLDKAHGDYYKEDIEYGKKSWKTYLNKDQLYKLLRENVFIRIHQLIFKEKKDSKDDQNLKRMIRDAQTNNPANNSSPFEDSAEMLRTGLSKARTPSEVEQAICVALEAAKE